MKEWNKDTTRLDILQELAKSWYFQERYDSAFYYYEKFVNARERISLDIYHQEDIKIALVYKKKGLDVKASKSFNAYTEYCKKDQSIYKSASMAVMYAYEGKSENAIEQLKVFATQDNFQYWTLLFLKIDPPIKPLKSHPEFDAIMQKIEDRFWEKHNILEKLLENKGLISSVIHQINP